MRGLTICVAVIDVRIKAQTIPYSWFPARADTFGREGELHIVTAGTIGIGGSRPDLPVEVSLCNPGVVSQRSGSPGALRVVYTGGHDGKHPKDQFTGQTESSHLTQTTDCSSVPVL